ncbi:hypothetical protein DY000_02037181 [Brassica cretica]|uniref:Xylanase inhibitor N-terminal domain-containing protein n=1 Tax=Brassica cretica TaxID=69181 RepID=A0ABQ7B909_BRACR|nr:hypothetical protein DY000_02037181 [Brassica cretica]
MWRSLGVVELSRVCLFAKAIPKKLRADRVMFLLPGGLPGLRFVTLADDITCGVDGSSSFSMIGPNLNSAGIQGEAGEGFGVVAPDYIHVGFQHGLPKASD